MSDREREALRRSLLREIRKEMERVGFGADAKGLKISLFKEGAFQDVPRAALLTRDSHLFEDQGPHEKRVSYSEAGTATPEMLADAVTFIRPYVAAVRRDRAIRAAGGKPMQPPAWSFTVHPLVLGILAANNIPADVACSIERGRLVPRHSHKAANRKISGEITRWHINFHELKVTRQGKILLEAKATDRRGRITLKGHYPQSLAQGLGGQPLSSVIGHPAFAAGTAAGSLVINEAVAIHNENRPENDCLVIVVRAKPVPLAPAPDGADMSWLELASA